MVNRIPDINVKREIKKITRTNPLLKDIVCLVGCFEQGDENTPTLVRTLTDAETAFGDDTEYLGNASLKQINPDNLTGVIIVNIPSTTSGSGDNITINQNITKAKLETALATIRLIDFDYLYVASELTDELVTVVDDFCNDRFEDKRACVYTGVGTRNNASAYETTANKIGDNIAAFLTQPLIIEDETLSIVESGAWLTNYIATLPVGNSLTAKELTGVTGVGTTYTFEDGDLGKTLVGLGFFVVRLIDALNDTYECVNSAGPNGLDLYMTRVLAYIVNDFSLRKALGERNNLSMSLIELELGALYKKFIKDLGLVIDIEYTIEKEDAETVNVIISRVVFAGVVITINVFITIEVE